MSFQKSGERGREKDRGRKRERKERGKRDTQKDRGGREIKRKEKKRWRGGESMHGWGSSGVETQVLTPPHS